MVEVHSPAADTVGNEFETQMRAEFEKQTAKGGGTNGNGEHKEPVAVDKPKDEPAGKVEPEAKVDKPGEEVAAEADPLAALTAPETKEAAKEKVEPEGDETPEKLPEGNKEANAAFAKVRKEKREAREEARKLRETLQEKEKTIAELSSKASGDLAKELAQVKEQLAARTKALAEIDVTHLPEYEENVTRPTTTIEGYFKRAAEKAGVEFEVMKEAFETPDVFDRNKKLEKALAELTEADRLTAYQAAGHWHEAQAQKAEFIRNAEAYQKELQERRSQESTKAAEGYKKALSDSQEKLWPALQKSIPVLSDDSVLRTVRDGVSTALSKNLTPDVLVGAVIALHSMPAMKDKLAQVMKERDDALNSIRLRNSSEPSVSASPRDVGGEQEVDFMEGLALEASRQGMRMPRLAQ